MGSTGRNGRVPGKESFDLVLPQLEQPERDRLEVMETPEGAGQSSGSGEDALLLADRDESRQNHQNVGRQASGVVPLSNIFTHLHECLEGGNCEKEEREEEYESDDDFF